MSLNSIFLSVVFAISLTASLVAQTKSTESKESAAQEPEVEQVEQDDDLAAAYESVELRGWTLMVNRQLKACLLYTSPSPRDRTRSRMPSSA